MALRTWNVPWNEHLITVEESLFGIKLAFDGVQVGHSLLGRRVAYEHISEPVEQCAHEPRAGAMFCPICGNRLKSRSSSWIVVTRDLWEVEVHVNGERLLRVKFS